jgi:dienelactone hydrolase
MVGAGIALMLPKDGQAARRIGLCGSRGEAVLPCEESPAAEAGGATPIQQVVPLARGLNETTHMTDAKAFIAWLDGQASVAKTRKVGTQGYCMGGPITFRTAAAVPIGWERPLRSMAADS